MVSLPPFCIPTLLYDVTGPLNEFCDFVEHSFLNRVAYLCLTGWRMMSSV